MEREDKLILEDIKGFIDFGIKNDKRLTWILANIGHDCVGIIRNESCFLPRTDGYRKYGVNWK